jgi:phospholipid/cholesterol/gamma-HCH transport system ATP-binding protein
MGFKMLSIDQNSEHVIEFKNVFKAFGKKVILNDVSFSVNKNEILAVIGPSGVGKSTILKLISNLIEPDAGDIVLSSNKKGMAFQFAALLNFLSVEDNVALPLRKKTNLSEDVIKDKVSNALESVGLSGSEKLFPQELSGGMQKRVSFARAVVADPTILLYDEPTSGLDPMTTSMIVSDICKIKQKLPAAGIIVTHDMQVIEKAADKVILLFNGSIVFRGSPYKLRYSNNPYAVQFSNGYCQGPMRISSNVF